MALPSGYTQHVAKMEIRLSNTVASNCEAIEV